MKQRIHVSQEDIDETKQGDPQACMVWRAVTRNLQIETETGSAPVTVNVFHDDIIFSGKKGSIAVTHSARTKRMIQDFDISKSRVEPFNFDLNLPDDWREQVVGTDK